MHITPLIASAIHAVVLTCANGIGCISRAASGASSCMPKIHTTQHHRSRINGVGRHHRRAVRLHQFLAQQNPRQRSDSEAITSKSPASDGVSRPVVARLPPSTTIAAPDVDPHSASQPIQSSRSPANSAAAAASSTGIAPTISAAWLTVVSASP